MLRITFRCFCLLTLAVSSLAAAQTPDDILANLRPGHPRLLAHADDFARIREAVQSDALMQQWLAHEKKTAENMLAQPVTTYNKPDGLRLLTESRQVEARVLTLAMLHRIEPDPRYVQRIWADMQAAANFPDWNHQHVFLDVAEMTYAFAIAYDWLYDEWSPQQRQIIRDAIIKHGLEPGLDCYKTSFWWVKSTSNWNQVCNGGMINGALAIADEQPELAVDIIRNALESLPIAMANYAPDGGYEEGPGYWGYGTRFNVFALCALDTALGTDFGLSDSPGYDQTAGFPIHMTGPTGKSFNFADASEGSKIGFLHFYFAKRFNKPAYARAAAAVCEGGPYELLWYDANLLKQASPDAALPLDALYQRVGVLAMRSAWDDPDAMFVAAKGGENGKSHGHLDLGTFVLDAGGQRWFLDLGADDYNIPGYFSAKPGGRRWTYYRCRTEGHNTLVIGPPVNEEQLFTASAAVKLQSQPEQAIADIDLSQAYELADSVQRRITLARPEDGESSVLVEDQIKAGAPQPVWWSAHTRAMIALSDDGRSATLTLGGKTLRAELLQPQDTAVKFTVMDAQPLPGSINPKEQNPNNGSIIQNPGDPVTRLVREGETPIFGKPHPEAATRKLVIELQNVTDITIKVRFSPGGS